MGMIKKTPPPNGNCRGCLGRFGCRTQQRRGRSKTPWRRPLRHRGWGPWSCWNLSDPWIHLHPTIPAQLVYLQTGVYGDPAKSFLMEICKILGRIFIAIFTHEICAIFPRFSFPCPLQHTVWGCLGSLVSIL